MRIKIATAHEIPEGQGRLFEAEDKKIVIHNVAGTFYASEGTCPHQGAPLDDAFMQGTQMTCRLHGWEFDLETGACSLIPGVTLEVYPVSVEEGDIYITLE